MKNLFSRLAKVEEQLKEYGHNNRIFIFADGQTYEMPENRIWPMFLDSIRRKPNPDADFFKKQLEVGNPDDSGMVYALEPYVTDVAEVFADELGE